MGRFSVAPLLPRQFRDPDTIDRLGMPSHAVAMRAGFDRGPQTQDAIVFGGRTVVSVRLAERVWTYRQPPETAIKRASRWRLEFSVNVGEAAPLAPGHQAVVAQEPYSSGWLQRPVFKMYSKKSKEARPILEVPALSAGSDPIEWLEQHSDHDAWEKGARLVAGISRPKGFFSDRPRNSAGDLVLGVCPDFDAMVSELWTADEIQHLLYETSENRIVYWNRAKVQRAPRLDPEVIEDSISLMAISIQQALAGPRNSPEKWIGKPVSSLADLIYRDHLNERNRVVHRRHKREVDGGVEDLW